MATLSALPRITKKAIRDVVREALEGTSLGIGMPAGQIEPIDANPIVDPTTASTDPGSPGYAPQNRAEFTVAVGRLTDGVPEEQFPGLYKQVQAALAAIDADEENEMKRTTQAGAAVAKTSADSAGAPGGRERVGMQSEAKLAEEKIRLAVRRLIAEATPGRDFGYSGPDTYALAHSDEEPWKVYEFTPEGKRKRLASGSFETEEEAEAYKKTLANRDVKSIVVDETPEVNANAREKGEWSVDKGDDGMSFGDIAKSMGMSVMGAQALTVRAMRRFKHMYEMLEDDPEEFELLVLGGMKDFLAQLTDDNKSEKLLSEFTGADLQKLLPESPAAYREFLVSSGELTPADVQLLADHPTMVVELDGFCEWVLSELREDLKAAIADLPNELEKIEELDAFKQFLGKHIKASVRAAGGSDE